MEESAAVAEVQRAIWALQLELTEKVWDDVNARWSALLAELTRQAAVVEAARELNLRRDHHGEMYGCIDCYHARKPEDRCPEGRLIDAIAALDTP